MVFAQRTRMYLFEVLQDAVQCLIGAALVGRPAVDGRHTLAGLGLLGAHLRERPVVSTNHRAARLEARQVLQQVRPIPSLHVTRTQTSRQTGNEVSLIV